MEQSSRFVKLMAGRLQYRIWKRKCLVLLVK